MVSPCTPAPLVRGSSTSAPHWPTGSAYLHRHTELAAVITRQTATPKGEEPTPLKGTEEEIRLRPPDQRMVENWEGPAVEEAWKSPGAQSCGGEGAVLGTRSWKGWKLTLG